VSHDNRKLGGQTLGLDLGDRSSRFCLLGADGKVLKEGHVGTTRTALRRKFAGVDPMRVVIETGTHSPWVADLFKELGHEVIIADARRLQLIARNRRKSDRRDADLLARLGRVDTQLLHPIRPRTVGVRQDLTLLRSRAVLVEARTKLVNHVRGTTKSLGYRLRSCSARSLHQQITGQLPASIQELLDPVLRTIASLTERIRELDQRIEELCRTSYPDTAKVRQVQGVGPLTALCFVLTIEQADRFDRRRQVGAYLGLVPRRDQSGASDPELHITKTGDRMLRTLLIQCAHYVMGPFAHDSDLRRFGLRLASRGGKNARKRAIVAVARKLAVLLHSLWSTGEVYEPLRNAAAAAPTLEASA
jgi:transposase